MSKRITFTGTLHYIDEYKRLFFILCPDSKEKFESFKAHKGGKSPVSTYEVEDAKVTKVRVNLIKYDKPNIKRYENLLKKKMNVTIERNDYESEQYGAGTSLKLLSYTLSHSA